MGVAVAVPCADDLANSLRVFPSIEPSAQRIVGGKRAERRGTSEKSEREYVAALRKTRE